MIVQTAQEYTAYTTYDREQRYSNHRARESIHLILRDDRAISIENIGKLLNQNQIERIRDGKYLLILDFSLESCFHFVDTIYTHIIGHLNIPEENVLFVCSSPDFKDYVLSKSKSLNKKPISTEFYCFFERLSKTFANQFNIVGNSPLVNNHDKLYINLNRYVRQHRVALISLLYNNNLLADGYNSFVIDPSTDLYHRKRSWNETLTESNNLFSNLNLMNAIELENKFPLLLDTNNFDQNLAYTDQTDIKKYVDKTLLSLVTETNFMTGTPLFLTEKTFKPIGMKHPFILVSRTGTLKFLKTLGYRTFSEVIDESYDNEINDEKRLLLIIKELNRLKSMSLEEITNFKQKALPIVEHNYNVLMNKKEYLVNLI